MDCKNCSDKGKVRVQKIYNHKHRMVDIDCPICKPKLLLNDVRRNKDE